MIIELKEIINRITKVVDLMQYLESYQSQDLKKNKGFLIIHNYILLIQLEVKVQGGLNVQGKEKSKFYKFKRRRKYK